MVTYADLRRLDNSGALLALIYNICLKHNKVPDSWKQSRTVLIYKKGDREDLGN